MYRQRLYRFVQEHTQRAAPDTCSVCLEALRLQEDSPKESPVIVLGCYHAFHNACWESWQERCRDSACPNCKTPVTIVEG